MHTPFNPPHCGPDHSAEPFPLQEPDGKELEIGPLAIVGGCGHVGLPLRLAFARKGHAVDLLDTVAERVALVNSGRMPFHEDDAEPLLGRVDPRRPHQGDHRSRRSRRRRRRPRHHRHAGG